MEMSVSKSPGSRPDLKAVGAGVERGSRRTFRGTGKDRNVKRWKLTAAEMHVHTVAFYVF